MTAIMVIQAVVVMGDNVRQGKGQGKAAEAGDVPGQRLVTPNSRLYLWTDCALASSDGHGCELLANDWITARQTTIAMYPTKIR